MTIGDDDLHLVVATCSECKKDFLKRAFDDRTICLECVNKAVEVLKKAGCR